jgi:NAD(P)-dependent dehydrogenase (short-subunit alcohol dehydrogenase family)
MTILVTGGAGYIGSVTVKRLRANKEDVVVLDDLVYGHRKAVDPGVHFYHGRVGDTALLARIAKKHQLEACIHFAALTAVGESVTEPAKKATLGRRRSKHGKRLWLERDRYRFLKGLLASKRDECIMALFSKPKRKVWV